MTAPEATEICLNDSGVNTNGAMITGDLEIDAPKAHVENYVSVNGAVKVDKVADNTFKLCDKASKFEVWGSGKIKFAYGVANPPKVDIKTAEPVTLDGGIDEVEIQKPDAKIAVTSGNFIEKLVVPSGVNGTTISGEGRIASLSAAAPVTVETDVDSIVVAAKEAEITVTENSKVKNVTVASGVSEVKIVGQVAAIDVSAAGNDVKIDAANVGKIVVKDEAQAQKIAEQNPSLKVTPVYITNISVVYDWTLEENEKQEEAVLEVGEKLPLDGYWLKVTYSDGAEMNVPITTDMLVNKDYILKKPGTVELKAAYGGKEIIFVTIEYLERDIVTLKCTVGKHTVNVNGDGYAYDTYEIGPEYFERDGGLASVLKATSSHGFEIIYEYSSFDEEDDKWDPGLPTKAGSYVIRATTDAGESYIDGETYIWIWSGYDYDFDYIVFDTSKIDADSYPNVDIEKYGDTSDINESYASLGWINFKEGYHKDTLKAILDATISSYKDGEISYHYYAQGCHSNGSGNYYHEGLPETMGSYVIDIDSKFGATACIFVDCDEAEFAEIKLSVSSNGITCENENDKDIQTTISGNTVTKVLKNRASSINPITLKNSSYDLVISTNGNPIDLKDCTFYQYKTVSDSVNGNGNGTSTDDYDYVKNGLPTASGKYIVWIPVLETETTAETWCSFTFIIE